MLVYNLTKGEVTYKGRKVPPNGGSVNIPDLSFIPTRDRDLADSRVLAFGSLPQWWHMEQALKAAAVAKPSPSPAPQPAPQVEKKIVVTTEAQVDVPDKASVSTFKRK